MNYNDKQIGRNIKAIRNANGMNTLDFASYIKTEGKEEGISNSLLEKIENGKRHATDEIIESIAKYTGFSFSEIKYGDLTYLEKNEKVFDDTFSVAEIFLDKENLDDWIDTYQHFLQIVEEKEAMQSENFRNGMKIVKEKIQPLHFTNEEIRQAIDFFEKSILDGVDGCASINILSCSLYLYLNTLGESVIEDSTSERWNFKVRCDADFFYQIRGEYEDTTYDKMRMQFIREYDSLFIRHMIRLATDREHSDFAYYFLYLRYQLGLLDEKENRMDLTEMKRFSESFLDALYKMKNKYAIHLHDFMESMKDS